MDIQGRKHKCETMIKPGFRNVKNYPRYLPFDYLTIHTWSVRGGFVSLDSPLAMEYFIGAVSLKKSAWKQMCGS
jgi:hypothetical protein